MKNSVSVLLSPLLQPLYSMEGKTVVVIDILRATSTMCTALHHGAKAIIPVVSTEKALLFEGDDILKAGEREGQTAPGFDFGNSPSEYSKEVVKDKTVVLTTTNGTKCINASLEAKEILIGSFFNLSVLTEYLKTQQNDIILYCSGWKNHVNLEDTLFAGVLASQLQNTHEPADDSAHLAIDLAQKIGEERTSYLSKGSHPVRFAKMGNTTDLPYCMKTDEHPVLVKYQEGKLVSV